MVTTRQPLALEVCGRYEIIFPKLEKLRASFSRDGERASGMDIHAQLSLTHGDAMQVCAEPETEQPAGDL